MEEETLVRLGLSQREAKAYIALLKAGEASVLELSKITGEHRTNTYDTLSSLQKKGLATFVVKNNRRTYLPNKPENLLEFLKSKEKDLIEILPKLNTLFKPKTERPIIEVYEGIEGMRAVLNQSISDYLQTKKEIIAMGAQQQETRKIDPEFHKRMYQKRTKFNIKSRLIITEGIEPIKHPLIKIRVLPKGYKSPVATYMYGDRVSLWMFIQPVTIIVVESKELAESYRNYFELLWGIAKS